MADWVKGKVTHIDYWHNGLFSVQMHAPIAPFTAGQYTKLALEIDGERVQRAYSYLNAPSNKNLEFYLVTVPEGKLSPHLLSLNVGTEIMLAKQATGSFILTAVPDCTILWMLATGTAIGPYLSMLQEGKDLHRFQNIVLVHAVRFSCDLSYLPLMQKLEAKYKGKLRIQTVVSRENSAASLPGRIPALIQNGMLEAAVGLNIDVNHSHVMLCGNPQMVRDTQQILTEDRQMQKHLRRKPGHITSEHYW